MLEEFGDIIEYDESGYTIRLNIRGSDGLKRLLSRVISLGFRLVDATDDYLTFNRGNEYIIIAYRLVGNDIIVNALRYIIKAREGG